MKTGRVDYYLLTAALVLLALSVLMVFSATAVSSQELYGSSTAVLIRHVGHILIGLVLLAGLTRIDPKFLRRVAPAALVAAVVMLIAVLIPGLGESAGGARRWLELGPLRMQPGELAKAFVVLYIASYISRHHSRMLQFKHGAIIPLSVVVVFSALLLLEPDFGSTSIILVVVFCQLLTSARLSHLLGVGVAAIAAGAALILSSPYRLRRLQTFLDPFADPDGAGYQLRQSLIAVGSGGVSGTGLGAGEQKLFYLPASHTDFIFAVISEELGMIGALFVLFLFILIAVRGLLLAKRHASDPYLHSLVVGLTMLLVIPALLNMGVVLGLLPTKGLVLPLVAYGGTAMVVNLMIIGVLLSISRLEPE